MKPQAGAQRHPEPAPEIQGDRSVAPSSLPPPELSDLQREVVDCLRGASKPLTVRQLEARVLFPTDDLQEALDVLVERRLVARLNTIIPSYADRPPSAEVPAG